ncbi:DUF3221 domain-containing protein [Enterococcus asini]|uniref:DUF3221 domain-containing protein n=1 Tax=Enterococcus asini TaxID=57732 RepID=UPI0028917F55|nr:DUF3221 domain-containing protein [Enterococcus asini]MDT2745172.1 hypothetical protein [Enterococcus asini]
MKKFSCLIIIMFTVFLLSACHKQPTSQTSGTITDIYQNTITILTDDGKSEQGEQKQGDLSFEWGEAANFKIGERIKITIQGPIRTSFPAIAEVTHIEKLAE